MKHKTEIEGFVRDSYNQALLNTNVDAYTRYKEKRKSQQDHESLRVEVKSLKDDVDSIKKMLEILIQRETNGTSNS